MSRRLISYEQLREKGISYSRVHLFRKVKDGTFPKPVSGAGKTNAWLESEIDEYIDNLLNARNGAAA
jgi:predicted DNA-binding transcriptional regulator AlpA